MAIWNIEQKTEVWYRTTVEADTFAEAVAKADDSGDWYRHHDDHQEWLEEYWGENTETSEQFSLINGNEIQEA